MISQLTPPPADSQSAPPPLGFAVWEDTQIILNSAAPSPMRNVFTGEECPLKDSRISLADALADFPLALLTNLPPA